MASPCPSGTAKKAEASPLPPALGDRHSSQRTHAFKQEKGEDCHSPLPFCSASHALFQPRATSSTIITKKPAMTPKVPTLECSPKLASGISSSTTT